MSDERDDGRVDLDLGAPAPEDDSLHDADVEILSIGDEPVEPEVVEPAPPAADSDLAVRLAAEEQRYLRLRAEFENFKKRLEREREERERRALASAFLDLLPGVDNLERALIAKGGVDDLRKGVELVARQLVEILRRFGLAEIPAIGQPFDPRVHEAVAREESDEVEVPTVVAELQRGYWLNERLLRPAMVKVALPHEPAPAGRASASSQEPGGSGEGAA